MRFDKVLDRLMPEAEPAILLSGGRRCWDLDSLRDALVSGMLDNLDGDGRFRSGQRVPLAVLPGTPDVAIEHMLGEYWRAGLPPVHEGGTPAADGGPGL